MSTYITKDGIEVKRTGRIAKRQLQTSQLTLTLVEITPLYEDDGTWRKWVDETTLYVVSTDQDAQS